MSRAIIPELALEAWRLGQLFPGGTERLRAGILRWSCQLEPSEVSRRYQIRLEYDAIHHPTVRVMEPALEPNEQGELPHIYPDGSLCLYQPGEWRWGDRLAETIIPWSSEWLLHYEIWKVTNVWHGSGGDHTGPFCKPTEARARGGHTGRRRASRRRVRRSRRTR